MHLTTTEHASTTTVAPDGTLTATFLRDGQSTTVTLAGDDLTDLLRDAGWIRPAEDAAWTHDNDLLDHHIVSAAIDRTREEGYEQGQEDRHGGTHGVLTRWHDEHHGVGSIDTCYEQPCHDVRQAH